MDVYTRILHLFIHLFATYTHIHETHPPTHMLSLGLFILSGVHESHPPDIQNKCRRADFELQFSCDFLRLFISSSKSGKESFVNIKVL